MNGELVYSVNDYRDYLEHHGIPGMRWGVRRYQNADGSLTAAGKKRQANQDYKAKINKAWDDSLKAETALTNKYKAKMDKLESDYDSEVKRIQGNKSYIKTIKDKKAVDALNKAWDDSLKAETALTNKYKAKMDKLEADYDSEVKRIKEEHKSQKAEAKAQSKAEKAAKKREKVLNDPKLLKKHFNEYSEKEINDALKKFDQMQRLDTHTKNRSKAGKIKKAMAATVGTGALIVSGYNTYQSLKKIAGR